MVFHKFLKPNRRSAFKIDSNIRNSFALDGSSIQIYHDFEPTLYVVSRNEILSHRAPKTAPSTNCWYSKCQILYLKP